MEFASRQTRTVAVLSQRKGSVKALRQQVTLRLEAHWLRRGFSLCEKGLPAHSHRLLTCDWSLEMRLQTDTRKPAEHSCRFTRIFYVKVREPSERSEVILTEAHHPVRDLVILCDYPATHRNTLWHPGHAWLCVNK